MALAPASASVADILRELAWVALPWLLLAGAGIGTISWLVTKQFALVRRSTMTAFVLAALGLSLFLVLARHIAGGSVIRTWDQDLWNATAPLVTPDAQTAWAFVALPGNLYAVAAAGLLLFLYLAARHRWRDAYMALVLGPVNTGLCLLATVVVPRPPPLQAAPFATFGTFPDPGAATLGPLVAFVAWILVRGRPRTPAVSSALWAAGGAVAVVNVAAFLAGHAWATDIVAGWLMGASLLGLAFMARRAYDAVTHATPPAKTQVLLRLYARLASHPRLQALGTVLHRHLYERPTALWVLLALGVGSAVASYWTHPLGMDAPRYAVMGESFRQTGTFLMPWGGIYTPGEGPQYSHHYPPLYPVVLSLFFRVFGFSHATVHLAAITLYLASLLVTYACTRNLYGHRKGLVAAAVVAVAPAILQNTAKGYSESLVLLLFVATLWAILKSLERPRFIVLAGLLAGVSYLTKSSMGYFFIVAGLGGLAWRLYWKGWKVLKDKWYLLAILCFGCFVLLWAWRNWRLFGSFDTSAHLSASYATAFGDPWMWALRTILTFGFMLVMGYLVYLGLLPWLPRMARFPKLATEHDSGLWLAVGLPILLTAMIDSALWMHERHFFFNNLRYVSFVIVPLTWLILRNAPWDRTSKFAATVSLAVLVGLAALLMATPNFTAPVHSSQQLGTLVDDGDLVAFVGVEDVYRYYIDATAGGTRDVSIAMLQADGDPGDADWIVVDGTASFTQHGYEPVAVAPRQRDGAPAITIWGPS